MKKKTFAPQKGTWLPMVLLLLMTLRLGMHVAHAERSLPCVRSADDGSWDCDCKNSEEAMLLNPVPNHVETVRIHDCNSLRVRAETFSAADILRSVQIAHVGTLILENDSFRFRTRNPERQISMGFLNVTIPNLSSHAIHGHLDEVLFEKCRFGHLHSFAVSPTREMRSLSILGCTIDQMDRHVLKKFSVQRFTVDASTFTSAVPSTMVYDVVVTERLVIGSSNFTEIWPNAFQFEDVRLFDLSNNRIGVMNGSSFHMRVADQVRVTGNVIADMSSTAFLAITSTYPIRPQENLHFQQPDFTFADNRLDIFEHPFRVRFDTTSFAVTIAKLHVITPISCALLEERLGTDNAFLRSHGDSIYFRTDDTPGAGSAAEIDRTAVAYSFLANRKCVADQTVLYIATGVSVVVLVVLAALAILWWMCRRRRRAIEQMTMVMPEPKTYRETQIVIQIENAGLLKTDL